MGKDTVQIDLGVLEIPEEGEIVPEVEVEEYLDPSQAVSYDLSDLSLDPAVIGAQVQLQRAETEAREADIGGWVARALTVLLGIVSVLYVVLPYAAPTSSALEAAGRVFPSLTALVGMVVGYYFSARRRRS